MASSAHKQFPEFFKSNESYIELLFSLQNHSNTINLLVFNFIPAVGSPKHSFSVCVSVCMCRTHCVRGGFSAFIPEQTSGIPKIHTKARHKRMRNEKPQTV